MTKYIEAEAAKKELKKTFPDRSDLISRQAAIDAICDCVCGEQKHKCDGIGCWYNGRKNNEDW